MNEELFRKVREYLVGKFNPSFIMIFGSYAKGTNRHNSDIDIAFFCRGGPLPAYETFMAAQELANLIKFDVDLIDLMRASTVFKAEIYTSGLLLYTEDETFFKEQQMTALSMYAKFNAERKVILDKIYESGSIYEK